MLVAVTRLGVLFRNRQGDGLLRAGVYTGQTSLAVARNVDGLAAAYANGTGRTDLFTDSTARAGIRDAQKVLPCVCGHLPRALQKLAVSLAVGLCNRGDHALAFVQVGEDGCQLAFHILIELLLFLHIKAGQPVIHHLDHIDISGINP